MSKRCARCGKELSDYEENESLDGEILCDECYDKEEDLNDFAIINDF